MSNLLRRLVSTKAPAAVLLIRLMVGLVFLSEGIQKFLFPDERGVGRFLRIGLPAPTFLGYFVAAFEVTCGALIALGLLTRLAVLPTIAIMVVAISTTKLPLLTAKGFWEMAHEARTDLSMLLGSIFLLAVGAGPLSVDERLGRRLRSCASPRLDPSNASPSRSSEGQGP